MLKVLGVAERAVKRSTCALHRTTMILSCFGKLLALEELDLKLNLRPQPKQLGPPIRQQHFRCFAWPTPFRSVHNLNIYIYLYIYILYLNGKMVC